MCILLQQPCGLSGFPGLEVWWLGCCRLMAAFLPSGGVVGCRGVFQHPPTPRLAYRLPEWKYLLQLSISFCSLLLKLQWRGFRVVWG